MDVYPVSRLRGHKDAITKVLVLKKSNRLISASKDTLVKVWDLEAQYCVQTILGHRNEVWYEPALLP